MLLKKLLILLVVHESHFLQEYHLLTEPLAEHVVNVVDVLNVLLIFLAGVDTRTYPLSGSHHLELVVLLLQRGLHWVGVDLGRRRVGVEVLLLRQREPWLDLRLTIVRLVQRSHKRRWWILWLLR